MLQATLTYALMLAVMLVPQLFHRTSIDVVILCRTFQVGYFVAIVAGLGVGEVMFGRWTSAVHH